jgi:FkbM family methyltransferase
MKKILKKIIFKILGKYKISINDKCFLVKYSPFWENVNNGSWEPETFKIFDYYLDDKYSYIDIGAWIGPTVLYGCQLSKKCYAFEPDPVAIDSLNKNIELNQNLKNKIEVYNICISYESGKVAIGNNNCFGNSMTSMLSDKNNILVKSITIQEFIKQKNIADCNFIKMDIEGGEFNVLPFWKDFLKENKITMHLSLHPKLFRGRIKEYVEKIYPSIENYKYIYDHEGILLINENGLLDFLLKEIKGTDVLLTDREWLQH